MYYFFVLYGNCLPLNTGLDIGHQHENLSCWMALIFFLVPFLHVFCIFYMFLQKLQCLLCPIRISPIWDIAQFSGKHTTYMHLCLLTFTFLTSFSFFVRVFTCCFLGSSPIALPGHIPDIARCPGYGQCLGYGQFSLSIFRTSKVDVRDMASKNWPYPGHQNLMSGI